MKSVFSLSDELSQSKSMYNRLQTRLNPVPESLNSPDVPLPAEHSFNKPRRDDPRLYNRDNLSTSMISYGGQQQQQQQQSNMSKSMHNRLNNGYSDSSDPEPAARTPRGKGQQKVSMGR